MNNGEVTPTSQYVLSYNNNDFYSNNPALVNNIFTNIDGSLKTKNIQSFCKDKNTNTFYKNNTCSNFVNIDTAIYESHRKCAVLNELCKNNENYSKLKKIQTTHYASSGRYNDTTQYHNTEMIKSVNLGIGIIGLSFVIYTLY